MSEIKDGGPGALPPVKVLCPNDEWENFIRKYGVVNAVEWFGYESSSQFTKDTIEALRARGES